MSTTESEYVEFGYTVKINPLTGEEISDSPRGSVFMKGDFREWTAEDVAKFPEATSELDNNWRLIICVSTSDVYAVGKFENLY